MEEPVQMGPLLLVPDEEQNNAVNPKAVRTTLSSPGAASPRASLGNGEEEADDDDDIDHGNSGSDESRDENNESRDSQDNSIEEGEGESFETVFDAAEPSHNENNLDTKSSSARKFEFSSLVRTKFLSKKHGTNNPTSVRDTSNDTKWAELKRWGRNKFEHNEQLKKSDVHEFEVIAAEDSDNGASGENSNERSAVGWASRIRFGTAKSKGIVSASGSAVEQNTVHENKGIKPDAQDARDWMSRTAKRFSSVRLGGGSETVNGEKQNDDATDANQQTTIHSNDEKHTVEKERGRDWVSRFRIGGGKEKDRNQVSVVKDKKIPEIDVAVNEKDGEEKPRALDWVSRLRLGGSEKARNEESTNCEAGEEQGVEVKRRDWVSRLRFSGSEKKRDEDLSADPIDRDEVSMEQLSSDKRRDWVARAALKLSSVRLGVDKTKDSGEAAEQTKGVAAAQKNRNGALGRWLGSKSDVFGPPPKEDGVSSRSDIAQKAIPQAWLDDDEEDTIEIPVFDVPRMDLDQ